jgi:hypothetical protein
MSDNKANQEGSSSNMDLDKVNFDNEVLAYLSNRKNDLIDSHEDYLLGHTEIREVLNDFMSSVLLHKPVSYYF